MNKRNKANGDQNGQSIEQLTERHLALNTRKIQAETQLETATEQLDKLKAEAREKYGTDDVEELSELLESMKAENEQKRLEYQRSLDRIESDLAEVEQKFAAASQAIDEAGEAST